MSDVPPDAGNELALELALERISRVRDLVRCSTVSKSWADAVARTVLRINVDCTSGGIFGPACIPDESDNDGECSDEYKGDGLTYGSFLKAVRVFPQLTSLTVTSIQQAFGDAFLKTLASSCAVLEILDLSCMCYGEGDDEITRSGLNSLFAGCPQLKRLSFHLGHVSAKRKISNVLTTTCSASSHPRHHHDDVAWSESALLIPSSITLLPALEVLEITTDRCLVLGRIYDPPNRKYGQSDSARMIDHLTVDSPTDSSPSLQRFLPPSLIQLQLLSSHHIVLPGISTHHSSKRSDNPNQPSTTALHSMSPSLPQHNPPSLWAGLKSVRLGVCCDGLVPALAPLFRQELTSLSLSANHATRCNIRSHAGGYPTPIAAAADASGGIQASSSKFGFLKEQSCSRVVLPTKQSISGFRIIQAETEIDSLISMHPSPTFSFTALSSSFSSAYSRLLSLHLDQCPDPALPPSFLPSLTRLTALSFSHCRHLKALPPTINLLSALTSLHMHSCHAVDSLPPEALCLPALRSLRLTNCRRLESVGKDSGSVGNVGVAGGSGDGCSSPLAIQEVTLRGCGGLRYVNWELLLWKTLQGLAEVMVDVNVEGCLELRGMENVMRMLGKTFGSTLFLRDGSTWNSKVRPSCQSPAGEAFGGGNRCVMIQM